MLRRQFFLPLRDYRRIVGFPCRLQEPVCLRSDIGITDPRGNASKLRKILIARLSPFLDHPHPELECFIELPGT